MGEPLALVHDYLTQRGGAERVVAAWCDEFPAAPLYSTLYQPDSTFDQFAQHDLRLSWLNHLAVLRQHHRWALPLLAPTISRWHIDADVVLASSSGWAHGVRSSGRLVVYCHAPARWLYQSDRYLRSSSLGARADFASSLFGPALRAWDQRAAQRADTYIANSRFTRDLITSIYERDAVVIAPPVRVAPSEIVNSDLCDVLIVARLLAYKNVDLALDVAAAAPHLRFRIVGDGPLREELTARATSNVTFVGAVSDDSLWTEYAGAHLHLALSHEDFGITPLEAAGCGRPTVARASGGYLDTITEETGVLVSEQAINTTSILESVEAALARSWDPATLRAQAARFSPSAHLEQIHRVLNDSSELG
jgi:glycosyltransferase involved in cell wall biosynthesis